MTQMTHHEPTGSYASGLQAGWRRAGGLLILLMAYFALLGALGHFAPQLRHRLLEGPAAPGIAAKSITPITSLTASRPSELGGSTTGSLYASADRIDIYARSASSATLNLVEYLPDDGKWVRHGADCAVDTNLTLCRYVGKRGARYWHVFKASGSVAYTGIEQAYSEGGLGSIEPSTGSAITLPLPKADGGWGADVSTGLAANALAYVNASTGALVIGGPDASSAAAVGASLGAATSPIPFNGQRLTGIGAPSSGADALPANAIGRIFGGGGGGGFDTIGAATKYIGAPGGFVVAAATPLAIATADSKLRRFHCAVQVAPGGTDTVACTAMKSSNNGGSFSDTAATCTITGTSKACSDTLNAPDITDGDWLAIKVVSSAGTAAGPVAWGELAVK